VVPSGLGLGLGQDADPAQAGIQTTVLVETELSVGQVALTDGGKTLATVVPQGGVANTLVTLSDGAVQLQAICTDSTTGAESKSNKMMLLVDSVPPQAPIGLLCQQLPSTGDVQCEWGGALGAAQYLLSHTDASGVTQQQPPILAGPPGTSSSAMIYRLAPGSYTVFVVALDQVYNQGPPAVTTVVVGP